VSSPGAIVVQPAMLAAVMTLMLPGPGLLAMLFPDALLRGIAGVRDPVAVWMLRLALRDWRPTPVPSRRRKR